MNFNLDVAIFFAFLVVNLTLGLLSSQGIKTIREYAVGDRNFSTPTIVATLIATWCGGGNFFTYITETYNNGLYFFWSAALGDSLCFVIIGAVFAPRLYEFLGNLSIAEAMGSLFGERIRIITAITGFLSAAGIIAIQLKVSGQLFEYCLNLPKIYGILFAGIIVTLYSAMGGIKAVTFTDVIQLFTFGTVLPVIGYCILSTFSDSSIVFNELCDNELFNIKEVFDFSTRKGFYYGFFFLIWLIPDFSATIFQRIAMAKNIRQVRHSFILSGIACFILCSMIAWIGVLIKASHEPVDTQHILQHILNKYSIFPGLAGIILAGVMAMTMSTADSIINSTSILFVHDFIKPLKIKIIENELLFSRITSCVVGVIAIFVAIYSKSLLNLMIGTASFYMPIVSGPFIMATFGFRSSEKSVFIGMLAGFTTVILWNFVFQLTIIEAIIPGLLINLLFMFTSHYLLKQPGGWVGIKNPEPLEQMRFERSMRWQRRIDNIKNFSLTKFFRDNGLTEGMYCIFGLYCIISTYSNIHTISSSLQADYPIIFDALYTGIMFIATVLLSYPLWLQKWKDSIAISVFWHFTLFSVLICTSYLLLIASNFAKFQMLAFVINLIIVAILVNWQWALTMMVSGIVATTYLFKLYIGGEDLPLNFTEMEFKSAYILLSVSAITFIFLRPNQERQQLSDEKNLHLIDRLNIQEIALQHAINIKKEFIRKVTHEYHTPLTGIISMSEVLHERFQKIPFSKLRAGIGSIYQSSRYLESYDNNIKILSQIAKEGFTIIPTEINLGKLVFQRIEFCRKLYEQENSQREFIFKISKDIKINVHLEYITQVIDNLIINAISYCTEGKITISLFKDNQSINFIVEDEGIGIPPNEIYDIFEEFNVSSKTYTPAGGRGVGLSVVKKVIEAHGGSVTAESDGIRGAIFKFEIPFDDAN